MTESPAEAGEQVATPPRRRKRRTNARALHLMLVPGILVVLVYEYGPILGTVMAFQDYLPAFGFLNSEWVGLENFRFVLSLPDTWEVVWNTVSIASMKIVAGLIAPLATALLINEVGKKYFRRGVQTIIYLPHFLSWVILGGVLIEILSPTFGIVNQFLGLFGVEPIYFLGDNSWFPATLVGSDTWKEFGFTTVVYLAAIVTIDPTLYEVASVDGAGKLRQAWHITLPGMMPVIVLMATLSLGNVLNAGFEQVLVLYSPQVYDSGDIIDTFVYRMGLIDFQYSAAAAVGLFKSMVALVLISTSYYLAYRFAKYRIF
ncbi:ABC transporter permease [Tenggerimyces flavus]|uniref:ABC transporter permease n=1 Tax=Tenggerimyces flavus TaxID=1708749 RepID=A0ABV7YH52_9ACTN|nr:ABC transporter permease subunit [Tenggerimyces flavus]MBM7786713.1 putative aldouronate transport system permease protein [Tenggerimyces flavus]